MPARFDRDELGIDPEEDEYPLEAYCPNCGELWDDCECEEEEEI